MKKWLLPAVLVAYLLSLFLPFMMKMDVTLYKIVSVSGLDYMSFNGVAVGILLLMLVFTFYLKFNGKVASFWLSAIGLIWLYLYGRIFIMDSFDASVYLDYVKTVFSMLQIGYYISAILACISFGLLVKECRK